MFTLHLEGIPNQNGKIAIVTGANTGLGLELLITHSLITKQNSRIHLHANSL